MLKSWNVMYHLYDIHCQILKKDLDEYRKQMNDAFALSFEQHDYDEKRDKQILYDFRKNEEMVKKMTLKINDECAFYNFIRMLDKK